VWKKEAQVFENGTGKTKKKQQKSPTPLSLLPFSFSNG
jgi:hypothetical protein